VANVAVAPSKFARGVDGSGREVTSAYEVLELEAALRRSYRTDAHLVAYTVEGAPRQPRINKSGLDSFPQPVTVDVFFCDVDNPGHAPWTEALLAQSVREYGALPVLQSAGVYHTPHGRRVVQPLTEPIPAREVEPYLAAWMLELEKAGLAVDWACRDWTRHFRLPNVRRGPYPARSPLMLLDRMRPIAPPVPLELEAPAKPRLPRPRRPKGSVPAEWAAEIPELWKARVPAIARAVREVTSEWHTLFLAVAGALLSRGATPAQVPAIVREISLATGSDTRTADRELAARTTVTRYILGEPCTGFLALRTQWPAVARALDGPEPPPPPPPGGSAEAAQKALAQALRAAPEGLTVIGAECGLGKTRAAVEVAAERARKPYASDAALGQRAPPQSKTAISVDKHALALQIVQDLAARGVSARRLFGPLSVKNADGEPECRFHDVARPLVDGGQPMYWELCEGRGLERCPYFKECTAKLGAEGPDDARVTVGPHPLLPALDEEAGKTGLLVIDEPPPFLDTEIWTRDDLALARAHLLEFEGTYGSAVLPAMRALNAWLESVGEPDQTALISAIVPAAQAFVAPAELAQARRASGSPGDPLDCAIAAAERVGTSRAPPLSYFALRRAKGSPDVARELGRASHLLHCLNRALIGPTPVTFRVREWRDGRVLIVTASNDTLSRALRREGAVIVTDANAELHLPVLQKVVGYPPPFHQCSASDGAPIERTLIRFPSATRSEWLDHGKLTLTQTFLAAVRALVDWALADSEARTLGIVTLHPVEQTLRAAHGDEVTQPRLVSAEAADAVRLILERWQGRIEWGHYGAVRGLNTMSDVDCLATLGDPWPNLDRVFNVVSYLGLQQTHDDRVRAECRAELEQAHGRIRPVHRKRPGRALHIGSVLPSGTGWTGQIIERQLGVGRPRNSEAMSLPELRKLVEQLGGAGKAAELIGCHRATLNRFLSGKRAISAPMAQLLQASADGPEPKGSNNK
jgi:hypothetical protein